MNKSNLPNQDRNNLSISYLILFLILFFNENFAFASKNEYAPYGDEKSFFIQKASKALRNGKIIQDSQVINHLKNKSKSEVFDFLINYQNPDDFYQSILKFNYYFLQFSINNEITYYNSNIISENFPDGSFLYNDFVYQKSQALRSVIELQKNGHYLALLEMDQPRFVPPHTHFFKKRGSTEITFPTVEERLAKYDEMLKEFESFYFWLINLPNKPDRQTYCSKTNELSNLFPFYANIYNNIINMGSAGWYPLWDIYENRMYLYCQEIIAEDIFDPLADSIELYQIVLSMRNDIAELSPENYRIKKITDLKKMQTKFNHNLASHYSSFFGETPNSSTNSNRKRAAHILSTYFCEDLTPIAFINPKKPNEHTENRHASDAACLSCHYKLDPMAGFFKKHGYQGQDFSKQNLMVFDDMVTTSYKKYSEQWLNQEQNIRKWNIGYIRSPDQSKLNDYGEDLSDLFKIIQNAPEVKSCLVEKMLKFYWGPDISIEEAYKKKLANEFTQMAETNSSIAFKETLKKIISANSFIQTKIIPGTCYDFADSSSQLNSPPCVINEIIQKNCVACHNQSSIYPYLNLRVWNKNKKGQWNFEHKDQTGKDRLKKDTLREMKLRISTNDPQLKMPKNNKYFSSKDRSKLFLWLEKELQNEK